MHLKSLQAQALYAANSLFVSDYLTTEGQPASEDIRMIEDLGFEIVMAGGSLLRKTVKRSRWPSEMTLDGFFGA